MNAQVIQMDTIPIVMLRHQGSYDAIGPVFDSLFQWVTAGGVPVGRTIGIYWDNPDYVSASRLRSAACAEVPPDFRLTDPGGLPLEISEIAAGRFVTTRFVGPYEELAPVWSQLTQYIERNLGLSISSRPAFEVYLNDPADTPPSQLITELYMPVL